MDNENSNHPDEKKSLKDDFDDSATPDDIDDSKVQFLNGGKKGLDEPHVVVEVGSGSGSEVSFTGLGKDELMQYANDPFWIRVRRILLVLFWVGWFAMLIAAILIIVFAPKCPERPDLKWYESDAVYKIDPKSFKDTSKPGDDGAGIGDLSGISQKIGYLDGLGLNAFWIRSFYKSGGLYDGNDVVDHKEVDSVFGTMDTFNALRKDTKKKAMKLILDFIPNHTGKKHKWFVQSQNKEEDFKDFYIWQDCTKDPFKAPNNWKTVYDTAAWQYDETRKQCYYFSYLPEYPDLNLRNKDVLARLDDVLEFWLGKGVDGFAVQGLQRLVEMNDTTHDEPSPGHCTTDQKENLDLVRRWRSIIDSFSDKPGRERSLFGHVTADKNVTEEYSSAGMHVLTTDALIDLDMSKCDSACMKKSLKKEMGINFRKGWMVDNENSPRYGSTVDSMLQKAFQALHLLLPGTAVVYYGDEIAMANGDVTGSNIKDPLAKIGKPSRDNYRTPMLWSSDVNAGFCAKNITPWLPVSDYSDRNVKYNSAYRTGYTVLNSFKDLLALRGKESFQWGALNIEMLNDDVMYFTRKAEGFPGYLVVINRGRASSYNFGKIAEKMTLVYDSSSQVENAEEYNTKEQNIGFKDSGEVYVFAY